MFQGRYGAQRLERGGRWQGPFQLGQQRFYPPSLL
jgi:hypothetical protein